LSFHSANVSTRAAGFGARICTFRVRSTAGANQAEQHIGTHREVLDFRRAVRGKSIAVAAANRVRNLVARSAARTYFSIPARVERHNRGPIRASGWVCCAASRGLDFGRLEVAS
jgi:hypothetical protein